MNHKDTIFSQEILQPGDFVFNERVVRVFPDMISRSVPGYSLIIPSIGLFARRYAQKGSRIYDLGCSLGAASLAMSEAVDAEAVEIIAVDNSPGMIKRLNEILAERGGNIPVRPVQKDLRSIKIRNASVVVLNFTLQFIAPEDRLSLLKGIVAGLRPGGILIMSEKLSFDDKSEQEYQTDWHHDFKRAMGYSELEIAGKRDALESVMITETEKTHRERLFEAGFKEVYLWFQAFSFASFVAIKKE